MISISELRESYLFEEYDRRYLYEFLSIEFEEDIWLCFKFNYIDNYSVCTLELPRYMKNNTEDIDYYVYFLKYLTHIIVERPDSIPYLNETELNEVVIEVKKKNIFNFLTKYLINLTLLTKLCLYQAYYNKILFYICFKNWNILKISYSKFRQYFIQKYLPLHLPFKYKHLYYFFKQNFRFWKTFLKKLEIFPLLKKKLLRRKSTPLKKRYISSYKYFSTLSFHKPNLKLSSNLLFRFSLYQRIFISHKLVKFYYQNVYEKKINKKLLFLKKYLRKLYQLTTKDIFIKVHRLKATFLKKEKKMSYILDFNKPLLKKLNRAQQLHWDFSEKRTLRNQRYKNFLYKDINVNNLKAQHTLLLSYCLLAFYHATSWYYVKFLLKLGLFYVNGKQVFEDYFLKKYDLIQFIKSIKFRKQQKKHKKKHKKLYAKIRRFSYIRFLVATTPWMTKKKKKLKKVKILRTLQHTFFQHVHYDVLTSNCLILDTRQIYQSTIENRQRYTALLKLQDWRFRAE